MRGETLKVGISRVSRKVKEATEAATNAAVGEEISHITDWQAYAAPREFFHDIDKAIYNVTEGAIHEVTLDATYKALKRIKS